MSQNQDSGGYTDADLVTHGRKVFTPVTFPSGRVAPNRLFKAALYEHFGPQNGGPPHPGHLALYRRWARGGWGVILTGNVQVAKDHLTLGRDMVIPEQLTEDVLLPWRDLADAIHNAGSEAEAPDEDHPSRPLAVMQLSHAGRQSLNFIGGRPPNAPPLAPSPIRTGQVHLEKDGWFSRWLHKSMHPVPREMTKQDVQDVISAFVRGAELAARSGFDGVQVHAAHGYLVSSFIAPKSNARTDEYSAEKDPLRFLREICFAIRGSPVVPADFLVGVKINSGDYARDGSPNGAERSLAHVREIGSWGIIDFIEVSGGDYEDPAFVDSVVNFNSPRQVIFESFAEKSMQILASLATPDAPRRPPLVVLTGGLTTLPRMASVLEHAHADLLGIGRMSVLRPSAPHELARSLARRASGEPDGDFMADTPELEADGLGRRPPSRLSARALERAACCLLALAWSVVPAEMPRIVCASAAVTWHNVMLRYIAFGGAPDYTVGTIGAAFRLYLGPTPYPPGEKPGGLFPWVVVAVGIAMGLALGRVL